MNINVSVLCLSCMFSFSADVAATTATTSTSFSEIAMQRFFKPWLVSDFIFRRSSYAEKHEKSLNILQNFTRKVSKHLALFDV